MSIDDDSMDVESWLEEHAPQEVQDAFERFSGWAYSVNERSSRLFVQINTLRDAARMIRNLFIEK